MTLTEPTTLLSALAHELRSSLTAGSMLSGLLVEQPELVADRAAALREVHQANRDSLRILDAFIAIDAYRFAELERVTLDPGRLVTEALEMLGVDATERSSVRVEPMPRLEGNPALLVHLWANLLANAFKFRHPRRALEIRCYWHDGAYYVEDNGLGVPPAQAEEIFSSGARLTARPGTGLGLMVVRLIAELHGGRAYLSPSKRAGARFALEIPSRERG